MNSNSSEEQAIKRKVDTQMYIIKGVSPEEIAALKLQTGYDIEEFVQKKSRWWKKGENNMKNLLEHMKEKLYLTLYGEDKSYYLKKNNVVTKEFLDLNLFVRYEADNFDLLDIEELVDTKDFFGLTFFPSCEEEIPILFINEEVLGKMNISKEELFAIAEENTSRECIVESIHYGITDDIVLEPNELKIITNRKNNFGASELACSKIYKKLYELFGKCYVLPSSLHEVILFPYVEESDLSILQSMVRDINRSVVNEEDVLSDSVYILTEKGLILSEGE